MEKLSVTLIQGRLVWENPDANRKYFEQKINELKQPAHIIILPEMFTTGFATRSVHLAETMNGPTVDWMKKIAADKKIILTGSVMIQEQGQYLNRCIWMQPNGVFGFYDKRHLFGYANEQQYFLAGNKRFIASVGGWRINLQICYDLRFPVWVRQQSTDKDCEYDMIIYCANWPASRSYVWKTLLQARAIENQCFVAGVNIVGTDGRGIVYDGQSMVIDPLGNIIYQMSDTEEVYTAIFEKSILAGARTLYPFWKDGDGFALL